MARVSVFGLGKLGMPLAALLARHHDVSVYDVNSTVLDKIERGVAPVDETGLQDLFTNEEIYGNLSVARTPKDAIERSDISFIIVPTPSQEDGKFTNKYVLEAVESIGRCLADSVLPWHVVVVCSTVMPGSMNGEIADALERTSRRVVGDGVGLVYNPEFIALGSVIHDMTHPDMFLIGESDERAGVAVATVLATLPAKKTPVRRMSLVDAEVTKLAVNSYITMKISFANMLGEVCEGLSGADATVVADAVGTDSRIGTKYLRPGAPFGGPCFPRDLVAFRAMSEDLEMTPFLSDAAYAMNEHQLERLAEKVCQEKFLSDTVGILGLSYKPNTAIVDGSPGLALARYLITKGVRVRVFDPAVKNEALLRDVFWDPSGEVLLENSDIVVIMTPWKEFQKYRWSRHKGMTLIDCWNLLTEAQTKGLYRIPIGKGF